MHLLSEIHNYYGYNTFYGLVYLLLFIVFLVKHKHKHRKAGSIFLNRDVYFFYGYNTFYRLVIYNCLLCFSLSTSINIKKLDPFF